MKIKYIVEDDINTIKTNLQGVLKEVVVEGSKTLSQFLDKENALKDSNIEMDSFLLDMSQPKGKESLTDTENVQRVYGHMKYLSDSQASDERIWAAYTLSEFLDYMKYRWPASKAEDIENRYIFGYSVQRSLFRNGIARLWWIGRFTYDQTRPDPYELTKFLCRDQDFIENICGRNIFNNPDVGLTVIAALRDAEKAGVIVNRECVRNLAKYVNLLSGTYLLDAMEKDEIYKKIKEYLCF